MKILKDLEGELECVLKKHGLDIAAPLSVELNLPRMEESLHGPHEVTRTIDRATLTIHAQVERPGQWFRKEPFA